MSTRENSSQGQDKGRGAGHADGSFEFVGDAHKRAQAKKLRQHKIVDQYRANENKRKFLHGVSRSI